MAMAAMMNQNDYMNNPFAYLIWMIFAMRMWNNQDGNNQGNAIQSQLDAMRSQIADNQNSSLVMDAIRGNGNAASNLGFQMSQMACDLKTNANANTQRIVDVLNNHWQSDLQQRYNDARLELSQQKQNATLIAALKTTPTAAA